MYQILYVDHRNDNQIVDCSAFEDAEIIAQFLADTYNRKVELHDGYVDRYYFPKQVTNN
jgi:hypothetical protein